jgi:hypothetical protein
MQMAKRWPIAHIALRLMNSVRKSVLPVLSPSHDSKYGRYAEFLKINEEIRLRRKGNLQPAQQKP